MEQKTAAEWLLTGTWSQKIVGGRDDVWAQVSVILKSVHVLLAMLSLLLEDTFHVFPFNRSNFKTAGAFCALHNSLMWKLFLKSGGELGGSSSQKGKEKWEKGETANTCQHRQMKRSGSQPLLSFYLITLEGSLSLVELYLLFFYLLKYSS